MKLVQFLITVYDLYFTSAYYFEVVIFISEHPFCTDEEQLDLSVFTPHTHMHSVSCVFPVQARRYKQNSLMC